MNHPVLTLWGETCFYLYFAYLFLEVHFFRGHLGYLLWGVHVARIRGYIHRRTAPAAPSPQWERTDPVVKKSYTIRLDPALASEVSEPEPADDTLPSETESSEDAAAFGHPDIPPAEISDVPGLPYDEPDEYDEDDEVMSREMERRIGYGSGVHAGDVDTLVRVLERKGGSPEQIEAARRAARNMENTEMRQMILSQFKGADGLIAHLINVYVPSAGGAGSVATKFPRSVRDFRLEDYV